MEYLTLNNGVRMPMLGYGTWDVRGAAGRRCIREALEVGYRLLDTACPGRTFSSPPSSTGPAPATRRPGGTSKGPCGRWAPITSTCC